MLIIPARFDRDRGQWVITPEMLANCYHLIEPDICCMIRDLEHTINLLEDRMKTNRTVVNQIVIHQSPFLAVKRTDIREDGKSREPVIEIVGLNTRGSEAEFGLYTAGKIASALTSLANLDASEVK